MAKQTSKSNAVAAVAKLVEILTPLPAEDRTRAISAATILLGESGSSRSAVGFKGEDGGSGLQGVSAKGIGWMKKNGVGDQLLDHTFSIDKDGIDVIAARMPGTSGFSCRGSSILTFNLRTLPPSRRRAEWRRIGPESAAASRVKPSGTTSRSSPRRLVTRPRSSTSIGKSNDSPIRSRTWPRRAAFGRGGSRRARFDASSFRNSTQLGTTGDGAPGHLEDSSSDRAKRGRAEEAGVATCAAALARQVWPHLPRAP